MKKIVITKYNLTSPKINHDIHILLLSDIHYQSSKDEPKLAKIYHQIQIKKPDYILISGDLLDSSTPKEETILLNWLKKTSDIATTIISLGNHDITTKPHKHEIYYKNNELITKIKSIKNLILLDNENYQENNLCFTGLTLPFTYYYIDHETKANHTKVINQCLDQELSSQNYNIILCHTPINLTNNPDYQKMKILKNADLILSGHMHGGMIPQLLRPIIKHHGLIGPFKSLLPKNVYGKYANPPIIITSGITKLSARSKLDFLDPLWNAELVEITIKKQP